VAALRIDLLADAEVRFAFPFGDDDRVRRDLLQCPEQVREGLRGRLLERQYLHAVVVEAKMVAVAFEQGIANEVVEVGLVLQWHCGFVRGVVEYSPKERIRGWLRGELDAHSVLKLDHKTRGLV
jgi:hypothetical protein